MWTAQQLEPTVRYLALIFGQQGCWDMWRPTGRHLRQKSTHILAAPSDTNSRSERPDHEEAKAERKKRDPNSAKEEDGTPSWQPCEWRIAALN